MSGFANGSKVLWTSHKNRVRRATVVTSLLAAPQACIVRITKGLPGEVGQHRVVPPQRLAPASEVRG